MPTSQILPMGSVNAPTLPLFILLSILITTTGAIATAATSMKYIADRCRATLYSKLCVQSLSAYSSLIQRNPQLLAHAGLGVSLRRAQSARAFVERLSRVKGLRHKEIAALKDCVEEMDDTVDMLSKSARELRRASQARLEEFRWHIGNVQAWVSSAIGNKEGTCMDGFGGRGLSGKVRSWVRAQGLNVVHSTSNALSLINHYAAKTKR